MRNLPLFPTHCEWLPPASFPDLSGAKEIAIDLETRDTNMESFGPGWPRKDGYVVGYAIAVDGWKGYFPVAHEGGGNMDKRVVERWVQSVLSLPADKVMHNAAYDLGWLLATGFTVNGRIIDTMIAAACLDENRFSYSLNALGFDYLKEVKSEDGLKRAAADFGVHPKKELWKLPAMFVGEYAEGDAELTLKLWQCFKPLLKREDVESVFELETNVLPVLVRLTFNGIRFDRERAISLTAEMTAREKQLLTDIRGMAGMPVDVWAAASIAKAFDALKLAYPRTETGLPSFTKTFLDGLDHPLAKAIIEARELNKTYGTFLRPYIEMSAYDGRIHPHVNQLRSDDGGTVTGRLCVHGDTILELNTGPVKISDYEPTGWEFIKTHTGEWRRILRRYNKGMESMVELVASNGSRVSCTRGHRVLTSRGWVPVGDLQVGDALYHVSKQSEIEGRDDLQAGHRGLLIGRTPDNAGDREENGAGGTHGTSHSAEKTARQATGEGTRVEVVALQDGGPQSHERQAGGASPQLQGRMLRREGLRPCFETEVVYGEKGQQTCLPTSSCDVRSIRADRSSLGVGSTSHRREPYEQPHRQLGVSHSCGASGFAQEVTVAEINAVGEARVWDIEVEGDHSYIAQGLIHHNSMTSPNLQQVPARHEVIGPLVRSLFLPEEGELWASCDFSSQEPRLLIHYASLLGLPGSDVMQAAYLKDPRTDFHQMVADMAGIKRKEAKTIGLGLTYGMGKQKLATSLDMSVDEASTLITLFHQKVPFLRSTIDAVMRRIESPASGGAIRTLLGRKCRFPLFEPVAWGVNKALPYEQAIIEYGPRVKRAMTYKGLNRLIQGSAADQTKAAMVALDKAGFRVLLQLHDEIVVSVKTREEAEEVGRIMATTVELSVPSVVDVETGSSWGTAK
jgi:DNA polymerase I-like protein with 3'-5' exonuclease and polymerase domains